MRLLFTSELSKYVVFKGGTSLSKVYGLIERFSEDIDLAIDREYLGFEGDLSKGEIRKLRRASHMFVLQKIPDLLKEQFANYGVPADQYKISVPNTEISDQDPELVHIEFNSLFEDKSYLPNRVPIEIGARSLNEPCEEKRIGSLIDATFGDTVFTEEPFDVRAIIPEKTFIEKLILLHEEFKRPADKIRHQRMSRHLYDIYQIWDTEFGKSAFENKELFRQICNHRAVFTPVRGIDYNQLRYEVLEVIPPDDFQGLYRSDYQEMQRNMIYGDSPKFDELIDFLKSSMGL